MSAYQRMIIGFGLIVITFLLVSPPWVFGLRSSAIRVMRQGPHAFVLNPPSVPTTTSDAYGKTYFEDTPRNEWSVEV